MRYWWLIFLLALGFAGMAQTQLPPKCFFTSKSINQSALQKTVFCLGDTVFAHFCSTEHGIDKTTVRYNWFNNAAGGFTADSFFVYQTPGTYTVYQRYTQNVNCPYTICSVVSGPVTVTVVDLGTPKFTVIPCSNNKVFVRITDSIFDTYRIDWGDGQFTSGVTPHAAREHGYASQGTFQITVTGKDNTAGCERSFSLPVTTIPAPSLGLDSVVLLNQLPLGRARIYFPVTAGFSYTIRKKLASGGSYTNELTLKATADNTKQQYTIDSFNTNLQWCFQIALNDSCQSTTELISDPICTVPLSAIAANGQNLLTWPEYPGAFVPQPTTYQLRRNKAPFVSVSGTDDSYDDTLITCGIEYCYQITALFPNNRLSRSAISCDTAFTQAQPPVAYVEASFTTANVLELKPDPAATAVAARTTVKRSQAGGAFQLMGSMSGPVFRDDSLQLPNTYCYQLSYQDSCGNKSPFSASVCPIILNGQLNNLPNGMQSVNLSWTAYTGFKGGVGNYELELLREDDTVKETIPAGLGALQYEATVLPEDLQILRFRVKGISGASASEGPVYSNLISFTQKFGLAIPSAFSPNNDNLNDIFEVKGLFARQFSLTVADRNGLIVFRTTNPQSGWDGKINGTPAPIDAYVYELIAKDEAGSEIRRTGTVSLVR